MAIISIFSGSFCNGEEVAGQVAERLQVRRIEETLLKDTARRFQVTEEKLERSITGQPSMFGKFIRLRERHIAYLKVVLADLIRADNLLLHGPTALLAPRCLPHVLRVCLIANFDERVAYAVEKQGFSEREATKMIRRDDRERLQWTEFLFQKAPYDETLYDMVIPMHVTTPDDAAAMIAGQAANEPLRTDEAARKAVEDFALAAHVHLALVEAGHDVEVETSNGKVTLTINRYIARLEAYQSELKNITADVGGVQDVIIKLGPGFISPPINPMSHLDMPSRVLLVDDEKEFVHTLSERLQTRNFQSSVVYDGEQALEFVKRDEPEVMVLDLRMPGIDGIEVLRRVKEEHPAVEVIILTGHGSDREMERAGELGAFAYLQKPVNIDVLSQVLKEAYAKVNRLKQAGRVGGTD